MAKIKTNILIIAVASLSVFQTFGNVQTERIDPKIQVALRMIGHELLLKSGDSSSRVLPIEFNSNQYKITFDTTLNFEPDTLRSVIAKYLNNTNFPRNYIVEMQNCNTNETIYSYEVGSIKSSNLIPCKGRTQPNECYVVIFNILNKENSTPKIVKNHPKKFDFFLYLLILTPLIASIGILFFKRKKSDKNYDNLIRIGKFHFDERNMTLILEEQQIELTNKESDLLHLLYKNVNSTVERDVILKEVWGDEGDYIGRTLDVYVSKLRKKLESDERIKINNIRGIGYKLILNID